MFMATKTPLETRVYRKKDTETDHYIIEDGMCNEFEMDYLETDAEVLTRISTVMDEQTELYVIPAKEVLDSPISDGYFIY